MIKDRPTQLQFVHLPIVDCATAADDRVLRLAYDLSDRMAAGETIYLHCWGGELPRASKSFLCLPRLQSGIPPRCVFLVAHVFVVPSCYCLRNAF